MDKLTSSLGFFEDHEPLVSLIDLKNTGALVKKAADEHVLEFVKNLNPDPSKSYVHINAMGAGEYYGSNKNGDYFPEENLLAHYKTFETTPGYIYRHHINKDPAKSIGKVIFAFYNPRMHRVELIAEVDKTLGADIEDSLLSGKFPSTSMACRTPFDVCSICGNQASSRAQYCAHLSGQLNSLMPDGRKVMAMNVGPLTFFDLSVVIRPADITSSILQKVASTRGEPSVTVGSAETAEHEALRDLTQDLGQESVKAASLRKLSELKKMIDDGVVVDSGLQSILENTSDLPESLVDKVKDLPIQDLFNAFASLGISPSVVFLAELMAAKLLGDQYKELGRHAVETATREGLESLPVVPAMNALGVVKEASVNPALVKALKPYQVPCSLFPEFVEKRATEVGFTPANYYLEETPEELMQNQARLNPQGVKNPGMLAGTLLGGEGSLLKALLTLGGIALVSKLYINSLIDKKMEKYQTPNQGVKIQFEKAGGINPLTTMSLVQVLKK